MAKEEKAGESVWMEKLDINEKIYALSSQPKAIRIQENAAG